MCTWSGLVPEDHEAAIVADEYVVRVARLLGDRLHRSRVHFEVLGHAGAGKTGSFIYRVSLNIGFWYVGRGVGIIGY